MNSTLILSNELIKIIPYGMQHIKRLEDAGKFPKRVKLGANRVAWVRDEVEAWLEQKVKERP